MPASHRIAVFFATSGRSGVDRLLRNLVPALAERGVAVDLLRVRGHGPELDPVPEGVRVVDLGAGHAATALPALVRYLRRVRPDVLFSGKDRINRIAYLARRLAGVPVRQVFRYGTMPSVALSKRRFLERLIQGWSLPRLYRRADRVLVPSEGVRRDLVGAFGVPGERVRTVASPVVAAELFDQSRPRPDHPWFRPGEPPVVLGVGELSTRKDFATLVRAFARLRADRQARLVLVGQGGEWTALEALARELGVAGDVDLVGFRSNPYDYMGHASVLALSSRWEGLGFVLVEAMALGTPVAATDCPSGPRELLDDGRLGPLVAVGDWRGLGDALARTLDAPPDPDALRRAAAPYEIGAATDAYLAELLPETAEAGAAV
ncbi:glycosyltransferase [Thiohalorhabdus sp.]|uniref:glycosyltransferase n=1 Tax=Thiohalorhabdus sp. TaxID=3094134 RepID=UPI002FC27C30